MYLGIDLAHFFGSIMTWGFLMATLYNVFSVIAKFKKGYSLATASFIIFMSYFLSDHIFEFDPNATIYRQWAIYDLVTIFLIFISHKLFKIKTHYVTYYAYLGLIFNTILFMCMYIDRGVFNNHESWWFWSFYSISVNISDYAMIIALILGRDFLGLVRFGRFIRNKAIAKKESFIEKQKEKRLSRAMLQA